MKKNIDDPFEYIERAFIEASKEAKKAKRQAEQKERAQSMMVEPEPEEEAHFEEEANGATLKLKRTALNAPRPRRSSKPKRKPTITEELERLIIQAPKNLKFLAKVYDDSVTQKYYSKRFRETREDLIKKLIDPELTLEDTARLLGVCPATVRRYTNKGWLKHHRTSGQQRRFRLSGIVEFVEKHGRIPE